MKKIKDPLYGYIDIEDWLVKYIDSPEFQRLRNIRQTGYESLYPGALHNRFVHSLGVFYLGCKAIKFFEEKVKFNSGIDEGEWQKINKTFQLACLLHDVGHSPFSHTGEDFYDKQPGFRDFLVKKFGRNELRKSGKPHEVMSAIVGIQLIEEYGGAEIDKELFVRCIIGSLYPDNDQYIHYNAVIQMLNGTVIDVDKLDYLIRDAYVTGYDSVSLDITRLLSSYTIIEHENKKKIIYEHGALSVIENVVYASDLERRWIQINPIILYDCKLLEHAIKRYDAYMKQVYEADLKGYVNILCREALSKEGIQGKELKLKLLCDDDIITYLKNVDESEISNQYFDRSSRLTPMWKNEIEYRTIIENEIGDKIIEKISKEVAYLTDELVDIFFIDEKTKEKLSNDHLEEIKEAVNKSIDEDRIKQRKETFERIMKIFSLFRGFKDKEGLPDFKFAIISSKRYESNYKKLAIGDIFVELGEGRLERFVDTMAINHTNNGSDPNNIFYVYTSRENKQYYNGVNKDIGQSWAQYVAENWRAVYDN